MSHRVPMQDASCHADTRHNNVCPVGERVIWTTCAARTEQPLLQCDACACLCKLLRFCNELFLVLQTSAGCFWHDLSQISNAKVDEIVVTEFLVVCNLLLHQ